MATDRRNLRLLGTIADHRVVTVKQLALIEDRNPKSLHHSLKNLEEQRLIVATARNAASGPGRQEKLVSLADEGYQLLSRGEVLPPETQARDVTLAGLPHVEHQLLLNWVRIHWRRIPEVCPVLRTRFVPHSSPIAPVCLDDRTDARRSIPVVLRLDGGGTITPDAVATIADAERDKTVLFFLEVDRGSEPYGTAQTGRTSIARKIQKYQRCFRSARYRIYDAVWDCSFRGFRVLFVTETRARAESLCRFLGDVHPREFIWVTDQGQLIERGVSGQIWARGGCHDRRAASILGSRADAEPSPAADARALASDRKRGGGSQE